MILVIHPYSHPDPAVRNERVARAALYVSRLKAEGRKALATCPLTHGIPDAPMNYLPWWALNRALVEACDEVHALLLDGWRGSRGMAAEMELARELGRRVLEVEA